MVQGLELLAQQVGISCVWMGMTDGQTTAAQAVAAPGCFPPGQQQDAMLDKSSCRREELVGAVLLFSED